MSTPSEDGDRQAASSSPAEDNPTCTKPGLVWVSFWHPGSPDDLFSINPRSLGRWVVSDVSRNTGWPCNRSRDEVHERSGTA